MQPLGSINLHLDAVRAEAHDYQGDCIALLAILRHLEKLHKDIRDTLFQDALPRERQALYNLLKDIESEGGWPYIYRPKLQSLLAKVLEQLDEQSPLTSDNYQPDNHQPDNKAEYE